MSNLRVACGPIEGYVWPSLGLRLVKYPIDLLTTCPYIDSLEYDTFVVGGPNCHVITSIAIEVTILTLSGR